MDTPRFTFPAAESLPAAPAFVACPFGMFPWLAGDQVSVVQQAYQIARERTLAVLAPSRVEKLYARSAN